MRKWNSPITPLNRNERAPLAQQHHHCCFRMSNGNRSGQHVYPDSKTLLILEAPQDHCRQFLMLDPGTDGEPETWWWAGGMRFLQLHDGWHKGSVSPLDYDSCSALSVCGSGPDSGLLIVAWDWPGPETQDTLPKYLRLQLCALLPHPSTCQPWGYTWLCVSPATGQSCLHTSSSSTKAPTQALGARSHWGHQHVKPKDTILKRELYWDRSIFAVKSLRVPSGHQVSWWVGAEARSDSLRLPPSSWNIYS